MAVHVLSLAQNLLNHFINNYPINIENIFIPNVNLTTKSPIKNQQRISNSSLNMTLETLPVTNVVKKIILIFHENTKLYEL
jgi:hypothetical protein